MKWEMMNHLIVCSATAQVAVYCPINRHGESKKDEVIVYKPLDEGQRRVEGGKKKRATTATMSIGPLYLYCVRPYSVYNDSSQLASTPLYLYYAGPAGRKKGSVIAKIPATIDGLQQVYRIIQ